VNHVTTSTADRPEVEPHTAVVGMSIVQSEVTVWDAVVCSAADPAAASAPSGRVGGQNIPRLAATT